MLDILLRIKERFLQKYTRKNKYYVKYSLFDFVIDCFPKERDYAYYLLGIINKQAQVYNITDILGVPRAILYVSIFESSFDKRNIIVCGIDTRGKNTVLIIERREKEFPHRVLETYVTCPMWNKGKSTIRKLRDIALKLYIK